MSTEWIRPDGCEGGACVEYRTVGDFVFVRNGGTENLSDDGNMLQFTVAEWGTFVAGLVAPVAAERDEARATFRRASDAIRRGATTAGDVAVAMCGIGDGVGPSLLDERDQAFAERDQLREELLNESARAESLTAELAKLKQDRILSVVFGHHEGAPRPFALHRTQDVSGVSGTGVVALGCEFPDGLVVLRWTSDWPTSVVFHERGIESVEAIHGHDGRTKVVWLSDELEPLAEAEQRNESLAAENARLRQIVGDNPAWARYLAITEDAALRRYAEDLAAENRRLIAEAEVLRHRDRRTRAVVEAARSLTTHGPAGILALADPAAAENWSFERDRRWVNLRRALDALEGPPSPPESTEPVQQPQPVVQPTDGPEPQGQAQPGSGIVWHHSCGRTATTSPGVQPALECDCPDTYGPWTSYSTTTAPLVITEGTMLKVRWPGSADTKTYDLTEVPDAQDETQGLQQREAPVPGPTRSEVRPSDVDATPPQQGTGPGVPVPGVQGLAPHVTAEGRTEVGLDAAIEAAVAAARFQIGDRIWPVGAKLVASDVNAAIEERIRIGVRAASPLIERAALNAAADRMEGRGYTSSSAVAWLRLLAEGKTV